MSILTLSQKLYFSIQTLKSLSNFSNVKRNISEIWRDGRKETEGDRKRETVGDRKEGEGDWEGQKRSRETEKEISIKKKGKGSMGETKKRRPKEPEKGRPKDTNKGDEKL